MIDFEIPGSARAAYGGWRLGLLELGSLLPRAPSSALDEEASRVEAGLQSRFGSLNRKAMAKTEPARFYDEHFAAAGRAYPVLLQAEAVAAKGRRIAMADPLVRAMFAAELEGMLLCSGQDLASLRPPLGLDCASGTELMPTFGGTEKAPPKGDLVMRDSLGIVASVLLGPDSRTSIDPSTERLFFTIYAPPLVSEESIRSQLGALARLARLACPAAEAGEPLLLRL
jgi:hypothetical protein